MSDNWQIKLNDSGFLKLNYYIEEQVALEYTQTPTERSSVDVWIYDILAKISRQNNSYKEKDLKKICLEFYSEADLNQENLPKPFEKALNFIIQNNFIEWFSA
jgi:hypothetical protein